MGELFYIHSIKSVPNISTKSRKQLQSSRFIVIKSREKLQSSQFITSKSRFDVFFQKLSRFIASKSKEKLWSQFTASKSLKKVQSFQLIFSNNAVVIHKCAFQDWRAGSINYSHFLRILFQPQYWSWPATFRDTQAIIQSNTLLCLCEIVLPWRNCV